MKSIVEFVDNFNNTNVGIDIYKNETINEVYCNQITYELSFWVITIIYLIIGLSCLVFCCSVCCTIFITPKK